MPGIADMMSLHRRRGPRRAGLQRGVHAADVLGAAVPLGSVRRGRCVGALRIWFVGTGIGLLQQSAPGLRVGAFFHCSRRSGSPQPIENSSCIVGNGVMLAGS